MAPKKPFSGLGRSFYAKVMRLFAGEKKLRDERSHLAEEFSALTMHFRAMGGTGIDPEIAKQISAINRRILELDEKLHRLRPQGPPS